jgi:NAD(P)-dependent dehydrogenase (short-subunit alcohol dehydrogenase family)
MQPAYRNAFGLEGRVCVVTGGGSGIGRGTALALAGDGAKVAVLDRNGQGANETLDLMRKAGGEGIALACDISDEAAVHAAGAEVAATLGPVYALVNNAGVLQSGNLTNMPLADWNQLFAINLTGYLICSQVFGKVMLERGEGAVVHTSSIGARFVTGGLGAYSITKAAVISMSNLFAAEWGPHGVRSNVILPGLIQTPLSQAAYDNPKNVEARQNAIPLRRVGQPDDLAQVALFLASPRSGYVNGAEIMVDGGFSHNVMSLIPRF